MKFTSILIASASAVSGVSAANAAMPAVLPAVAPINGVSVADFTEYIQKFAKKYPSVEEFVHRFQVFAENIVKYKLHGLPIGFKTDMTQAEIDEIYPVAHGIRLPDASKLMSLKDLNPSILSSFSTSASAEDDFSAELIGGNAVSFSDCYNEVASQGSCGSCWAWSSTAVVEGQVCLSEKKRALAANETPALPVTRFAPRTFVDCAVDESYDNHGCSGSGSLDKPLLFAVDQGVCAEADLPYVDYVTLKRKEIEARGENPDDFQEELQGLRGECTLPSTLTKKEKLSACPQGVAKLNKVFDASGLSAVDLANTLATYGPLSVAVDANFAIQRYEEGVLSALSCFAQKQLNHAVTLTGYEVVEKKTIFGRTKKVIAFTIKNSWGPKYGQAGYFKAELGACGLGRLVAGADGVALQTPADEDVLIRI